MIERTETIAVVGATPFAALLAGLLAADHSREVVLVAPAFARPRLARHISLFHAPVVRPETWALARRCAGEALRRLAGIGPGIVQRRDTVLVARGAAASAALHHMRHLAAGFGVPVEPLAGAPAGPGIAFRLGDGIRVSETHFRAAAPDWLDRQGVARRHDAKALAVRRDGSGRIDGAGVDRVILAGEDAVLAHALAEDMDPIAARLAMASYLTEPDAAPNAHVLIHLDDALVAARRADGAAEIVAANAGGDAEARIAASVPGAAGMRQAGRAGFTTLVPHDGAPVIGTLRRTRAIALVGLGPLDLVLAPAIARFLAGTASEAEADWCAAHRPTRPMDASGVAEFTARTGGQAA